jgi:hypothetical protein
MKKWLQNLVIAFVLLLLFFLPVKNVFGNGIDISIENQSGSTIKGLEISYFYNEKEIKIPPLEPDEHVKMNVLPKEAFSETSMKILYTDFEGNQQEEVVVGYFEKGYQGSSKVTAESVDSNGIITFKVDEKTFALF